MVSPVAGLPRAIGDDSLYLSAASKNESRALPRSTSSTPPAGRPIEQVGTLVLTGSRAGAADGVGLHGPEIDPEQRLVDAIRHQDPAIGQLEQAR